MTDIAGRIAPNRLVSVTSVICFGLASLHCSESPTDPSVPSRPDASVGDPNPFDITFTEVTYDVMQNGFVGGGRETDKHGVGSGAAVADIDADGDLDVFLARCDQGDVFAGPSVLLRNEGGAGFSAFVSDADIEAEFSGACAHGAAFGDYDRDGDPDLFVAMAGHDRLYENTEGVFRAVTATAGVAGPAGDVNTSGYFADLNQDGLLDLFVPAHAVLVPPMTSTLTANHMYINRGDGTFSSVADQAGVGGNGSSQAAVIADLDNDGALEIYVANDQFSTDGRGEDFGLDSDRWFDLTAIDSDGHPTYTDRSSDFGIEGLRSSMGVAIDDINQDGHVDMYVTDFGSNHLQLWNPDTQTYDFRADDYNLRLRDAPLTGFMIAWDAAFVDLDRDGALELFTIHGSTGAPRECNSFVQFDTFHRFDETAAMFIDITEDVGLVTNPVCPPLDDRPLSGRGLLFADLDGDEDDDLIVTPYLERYRFYRNDTPATDGHFLRIEPVGTVSAPTPYGTMLEVLRTDGKTIRKPLAAGGTNTQHYPMLEVSLGTSDTVESASLRWPSGYVQRLDTHADFRVDHTWSLREPEWLSISARHGGPDDPAPVLTYRPVDETGALLGSGRSVEVRRSDDQPVTVTDEGDGRYTATLSHPGVPAIVEVRIVDEAMLAPRYFIHFR